MLRFQKTFHSLQRRTKRKNEILICSVKYSNEACSGKKQISQVLFSNKNFMTTEISMYDANVGDQGKRFIDQLNEFEILVQILHNVKLSFFIFACCTSYKV